jgi:hypothetical protein
MHIEIKGIRFNQYTLSLPKLADLNLSHSEPVGVNLDNLMTYARAPKCQTVIFLLFQLLVATVTGQHDDNCP